MAGFAETFRKDHSMLPKQQSDAVGLDIITLRQKIEIVGMKGFSAQALFFLKGRGNLKEASAKAQFRHTGRNLIGAAWQNDLGSRFEGKA